MKNLEKITEKYSKVQYNTDNYSIGGGKVEYKQASNRHEDALADKGKLTFGKAAQIFKKATGLPVDEVKEVFEYAVPNPEWHHAGYLPKKFGGGMKKTYFLNSAEIVDIAKNFNSYLEKIAISKNEKRKAAEAEKNREQLKHEFLVANATKVTRVTEQPEFFYETDREMNGKYGWFSSYGKSYNMTEYYTGWSFESVEKYNEFNKL